ncbi:hypothetical protein Taro_025764 [Colocasia esculenta]|uniref:50S ribosomal protein L35 n=1 Tax=Colocasia esculenta TaxID=4460 RepID=A0A843VP97_COLES|nr:hypothetical protein [Colocasia esculenta]
MAASFCVVRIPASLPSSAVGRSHGVRLSSPAPTPVSLKNKLSSSKSLSGSPLILSSNLSPISAAPRKQPAFTVFAAKAYKMKTHKASAKRFRVTGRGKIVRRRAGKQHLLAKKNTKRKLRLSKMHPVDRSDYDNVIGALPYLKVNREANDMATHMAFNWAPHELPGRGPVGGGPRLTD